MCSLFAISIASEQGKLVNPPAIYCSTYSSDWNQDNANGPAEITRQYYFMVDTQGKVERREGGALKALGVETKVPLLSDHDSLKHSID